MQFSSFKLSESLLKALKNSNYHTPTPIQVQAIPVILQKHDLLACAQTGTGKTAAFALPIIQFLTEKPRNNQAKQGQAKQGSQATPQALILAPTRELAIQIAENIDVYTSLVTVKSAVVFGGVSVHSQMQALRKKPEILVATPGRLLDLIDQRLVSLQNISYFVLDEADRMLDMGFVRDIQKIVRLLPSNRQTLLFSATIPKSIAAFAQSLLRNPKHISVTPVSSTVDSISQAVYPVNKPHKMGLLTHLIAAEKDPNILVFSRTKHGADKIVRKLKQGGVSAEAIHGNKTQQARQRALANFKSGSTKVLVATDIAARGIDVDNLQLVINFDLPNEPETYVHRIGRTGRASKTGRAWSFCDREEKAYLQQIERLIKKEVPVQTNHPFVPEHFTSMKN